MPNDAGHTKLTRAASFAVAGPPCNLTLQRLASNVKLIMLGLLEPPGLYAQATASPSGPPNVVHVVGRKFIGIPARNAANKRSTAPGRQRVLDTYVFRNSEQVQHINEWPRSFNEQRAKDSADCPRKSC